MLAQIARSLAKLALKAHCAFNLSEFPLRVAFARYALCAKAGRRAAQATKKELQARKLEAPFLYQIIAITQLRRRNHPDHPGRQGNHPG